MNLSQANKNKTLFLFTTSFPFDGASEQTFLDEEIKILSKYFYEIIILPSEVKGTLLNVDISNVSICLDISKKIKNSQFLLGLNFFTSRFLFTFIHELFTLKKNVFNITLIKKVMAFAVFSNSICNLLNSIIKRKGLSIDKCVFYTFWFDFSTTGIGLLKYKFPNLKVVTRAHGYDLYLERHSPPYIPFREFTLRLINKVYPDSLAGENYLKKKYVQFKNLIFVQRLGVCEPQFLSRSSTDAIFRIISCSFMVPVKRLELLANGIKLAALTRMNQKIVWTHFGTGPLSEAIRNLTKKDFPENARAEFLGYSNQSNLYKYYQEVPVDVFVNVSKSEGTPVSIMEAISCGIPVIATAVGGNKEIVNEKNGILISENPTPQEVADTFFWFIDNPSLATEKRLGSKLVWDALYNSKRNYEVFAEEIINLK